MTDGQALLTRSLYDVIQTYIRMVLGREFFFFLSFFRMVFFPCNAELRFERKARVVSCPVWSVRHPPYLFTLKIKLWLCRSARLNS